MEPHYSLEQSKRLVASQDGRDFIRYLDELISTLDKVSDIKATRFEDIALEAAARNKAVHILREALSTALMHLDNGTIPSNNKEYVV